MSNKIKLNIFDNTLTKSFWVNLNKLLAVTEKSGNKNDTQVDPEVLKTLVSLTEFPETDN